MRIEFENIILRDMTESDIEDYIRWFTTETEWSNTDAPWEPIESDEETERKSWREYYESVKELSDDRMERQTHWMGKLLSHRRELRMDWRDERRSDRLSSYRN